MQKYEEMKAELIRIERMMLRAFGFIVHVEHPHKLVLNHLHLMLRDDDDQHPHPLMQEAWNLTNDRCSCGLPVSLSVCVTEALTYASMSCLMTLLLVLKCGARLSYSLRTTLCVRLKSEVVACGIIFVAARRLKVCRGSLGRL